MPETCELSGFPPAQCGCRIHKPEADRHAQAELRRREHHAERSQLLPELAGQFKRPRLSHEGESVARATCDDTIREGDAIVSTGDGWAHDPGCAQ